MKFRVVTIKVSGDHWLLAGRAHAEVRVGDRIQTGGAEGVVEAIRTYDRETDLLSRMMTGELKVRWLEGRVPEPPPDDGLVDWLLSCPEKGFFTPIQFESTDPL